MKFVQSNSSEFITGLKKRTDAYFKKNQLNRTSDPALRWKAFWILFLYFSSYIALFYAHSFFVLILLYILMGILSVMIVFNIVHDASHQAFSKNPMVNKCLSYLGDMVGINTYIWNIRHNIQHHSFTNVLGGDLIIENIPLIRLSPHQPYRRFHRFQHIYTPVFYMFYTLYWIFIIDFKLFFMKDICNLRDIKHPLREWIILFFSKLGNVFYLILLPGFFTGFSWTQILICFFIMHFFAGMLLSLVAVLGHFVEGTSFPEPVDGNIWNNWAEHQLEATIDFAPGSKMVHWITGGLNTHIVHHLFPHICHTHYYHLTEMIKDYCREKEYDYRSESLSGALASHIRYIKKLSRP